MSKTYYHFTTWQIGSELVGQQCKTDWEVSNYWQGRLDGSFLVDDDPFKIMPREMLNVLKALQLEEALRPLLLHLQYSSQLLKEYIFEEVRASEFPQVPSRKRCMFLFEAEQDEDAEAYLQKMGFELKGKSLIKVEPIEDNSVTHRTDAKLLDVNLSKQPEIATAARKYWHGTNQPAELPEVLLEGLFIIREVIKSY